MISSALTLIIIGLFPPASEAITLSCGNTSQGAAVNCTCSNSGGQDVEWLFNGIFLTACIKYVSCSPNQTGYTFSMDSSADLYFLNIDSHSYSQCGVYECRDIATPSSKDSVEISISNTYLDMTWEPKEQMQPSSHTDGNFSVTSPCLFGVNEDTIEIQWYTVSNGNKKVYFPEKNSTNYITSSCQACKGVNGTQIQTSFMHDESNPGDQTPKEVSFVVEIYNTSIPFQGVYYIFRPKSPNETNPVTPPVPPIPGTAFPCWIIIIIWIVITRLLYAQTWLSGYSIYRRRNEIKELNNVQSVEIIMVLLTGLPLIGLISCIWAYSKIEKDPKCLKWPLVGFIVGCIQPGFGLLITGVAYAAHVQNCSVIALVFTVLSFILLVGSEAALIVICTVCDIERYYYISFFGGFILVWIIAAVIMVIYVLKPFKKSDAKTEPAAPLKPLDKTELTNRQDVSGSAKQKNDAKTVPPPALETNDKTELTKRQNVSGSAKQKNDAKTVPAAPLKPLDKTELTNRQDVSGRAKQKNDAKTVPAAPLKPLDKTELTNRQDVSGRAKQQNDAKTVPRPASETHDKTEFTKRQDVSGSAKQKNDAKTVPPPALATHDKTELTKRQDVSGSAKLKNVDCTCDVCGQHVMHTLKGFCLNQNIFLCNSCLSKHKCKGKHLKHNQHDESGREKCFSCEKKPKEGHRNVPAHGYCLDCMLYLCTECLIDHNEHELLWMPHHDEKTFDDICCFKTRTDRNNTIPLGYCKTCKMYICEECTSLHNGTHDKEPHIIIFHQHKETQTNTKNCSECSNPMECYKLSANKYLCAVCYDSDSFWTKNTFCDEYSKTILKESEKCQLHSEVGDNPARYSPTDVFCLICKLYLCKECFKVHRRFRERWIATHEENLFTCKGCQEKNNVFPVECFCIKSKSFLCAVCFEDSKTTSKHATTKKYLRPETITRLSDKPDCELHKVPFQCEERKHSCTVYCLICKTYMCDDCFKKHLRLKQVWNNRKKEVQSVIQSSFKHNEVSPKPS